MCCYMYVLIHDLYMLTIFVVLHTVYALYVLFVYAYYMCCSMHILIRLICELVNIIQSLCYSV